MQKMYHLCICLLSIQSCFASEKLEQQTRSPWAVEKEMRIDEGGGSITVLALSPDDQWLAYAKNNNTMTIRNAQTGQGVARLGLEHTKPTLTLNANIIVQSPPYGFGKIWDVSAYTQQKPTDDWHTLRTAHVTGLFFTSSISRVISLGISSNRNRIYGLRADGTIVRRDVEGSGFPAFTTKQNPTADIPLLKAKIELLPKHPDILDSTLHDNRLTALIAQGLALEKKITTKKEAHAGSCNETHCAYLRRNGTLKIRNLQTGKKVQTLQLNRPHDKYVNPERVDTRNAQLSLSLSNKVLVAGLANGSLRMWHFNQPTATPLAMPQTQSASSSPSSSAPLSRPATAGKARTNANQLSIRLDSTPTTQEPEFLNI